MAASIGDWFDNASGRRDGGFGHDTENDDPVDHTPDAWLDDLHAPPTPERRRAPRARTPQDPDRPTPDAPVSEPLGQHGGSTLAQAARAVMAAHPGIGPKKLAARLRQRGWPDVTTESVQVILKPSPASKVGKSTAPTSKIAMSTSAMARRIRSIDASAPGWTIPALTKKIRERGWPNATEADVRKALLGSGEPNLAASSYDRESASPRGRTSKTSRRSADAAGGHPAGSETARTRQRRGRSTAADREARFRAIIADVRGAGRIDPLNLRVAMAIFERMEPHADAARLIDLLLQCGWTGLGRTHVDLLAEEVLADAARNSPTVLVDIAFRRAALATAVRAMRSTLPRVSGQKITSRLREWGWRQVTTTQVQDELRQQQAAVRARLRPCPPVRETRKSPQAVVPQPVYVTKPIIADPQRTLDIPERPNASVCPGCGRVVSSLGICGCS